MAVFAARIQVKSSLTNPRPRSGQYTAATKSAHAIASRQSRTRWERHKAAFVIEAAASVQSTSSECQPGSDWIDLGSYRAWTTLSLLTYQGEGRRSPGYPVRESGCPVAPVAPIGADVDDPPARGGHQTLNLVAPHPVHRHL